MDLPSLLNSKNFYLTKSTIEKGIIKELFIDVKPDKKFAAEEKVPDLNGDAAIDGYEILDFLAKNAQDRLKIDFACQEFSKDKTTIDQKTQQYIDQLQDKSTRSQYQKVMFPMSAVQYVNTWELPTDEAVKDHEFYRETTIARINGHDYSVTMRMITSEGSYDFLLEKSMPVELSKGFVVPVTSIVTTKTQNTILRYHLGAFTLSGLSFKDNDAEVVWKKNSEPCINFWVDKEKKLTRLAQDGKTYDFIHDTFLSVNGNVREGTALNALIKVQGQEIITKDATLFFNSASKPNTLISCNFKDPIKLIGQKGINYSFTSVDKFDAEEKVVSGICIVNNKPYSYNYVQGIEYFTPVNDDTRNKRTGVIPFVHITGNTFTLKVESFSRADQLTFTASEKVLWSTESSPIEITSITVNGNRYTTTSASVSPNGFYNIEYPDNKKEAYKLKAQDGKEYLLYWPQWDAKTGELFSGYLKDPLVTKDLKGKPVTIPANTNIKIDPKGMVSLAQKDEE